MKKSILGLCAFVLCCPQSCSFDTQLVYHKDASQSMQINADMKEMMGFINAIGKDSANNNSKELKDLEKFPKDWKSLYDIEKEEGKKQTTDPDSIRMMKKIFIKGNFDNQQLAGFSFKMDRITQKEQEWLHAKTDKGTETLPLTNKAFSTWDGKTLVIETKHFNIQELEKIFKEKTEEKKNKKSPEERDSVDPQKSAEQTMAMMKMFNIKFTNTLKFETNIIAIEGSHDWVKKVDNRTIQINFNTEELFDENHKFKNNDPIIKILTE